MIAPQSKRQSRLQVLAAPFISPRIAARFTFRLSAKTSACLDGRSRSVKCTARSAGRPLFNRLTYIATQCIGAACLKKNWWLPQPNR